MLNFTMVGHFAGHNGVDIFDAEMRSEEELEEFLAFEASVLPVRVLGFPFCHTFITGKDDPRKHSDDEAVMAQFAHEAAVAGVDGRRHSTQVTDVIVERVPIDMVDLVAFRDITDKGAVFHFGEVFIAIIARKFQIRFVSSCSL